MPSTDLQVKEKINELGTAFAAFKEANDERLKQIESKGSADPLLEKKLNEANEAVGKIDAELKELKTAMNRRAVPSEQEEKLAKKYQEYKGRAPFLFKDGNFNADAEREYKEAQLNYIRRGREEKALSVGSDPDGGYLVRPEVGELIVTQINEMSPFRKYMNSITIGTDAYEAPTRGGRIGARRAGEKDPRTETTGPQFGQLRIDTPELTASPRATQKLLEDSSVDIESLLAQLAAEEFMLTENNEFANGDGVGKSRGFLTYAANEIEQIASGHATQFTADGIISLEASLKSGYKANSVFFATRKAQSEIRKLKGSDNNYLWQPGLQAGKPSTLLGSPVEEAADMPEVAANALALAFGNFKVGYMIVERRGIRMLRDPFTAKPYVIFDFTKRVSGDVVVKEAIKLQKISE